MKRLLFAVVAVAAAGISLLVIYTGAARDREYRRLVANGDRSLAADQTFLAIEAYSGAIALKGESMLAYLRRGETYRRRGNLSSAQRDLREATRLDPTAPRPLEQLGDVLYELQRYARAAVRYAEYVELDSSRARIFYKLGLSRCRDEDLQAAVTALRAAVRLDDRFAEAHYLLGLCLADQEREAEALEALERAVALAPGSIRAREGLASLFRTLGRSGGHIGQLEALAVLDPDRPERLVSLGLAYGHAGRSDEAVLTLRRAAERFPEQTQVYLALARIWLAEAEARNDRVALSKALEALQNAGGAFASSSEALTLQGRALLLAGESGMAERVFQRAATLRPATPEAFLQLANAAARRRDLAVARDALIRYETLVGARQEPSTYAASCARIGELSLALGDHQTAVEWLERATQAAPPGAELLGRLAEARGQAGDEAGAGEALTRALEMDPTNRALLQLRRRLLPEGRSVS